MSIENWKYIRFHRVSSKSNTFTFIPFAYHFSNHSFKSTSYKYSTDSIKLNVSLPNNKEKSHERSES